MADVLKQQLKKNTSIEYLNIKTSLDDNGMVVIILRMFNTTRLKSGNSSFEIHVCKIDKRQAPH